MQETKSESLSGLLASLEQESQHLSATRQELLEQAATWMQETFTGQGTVNLLFVCTHNSRRSHLSDVWAQIAAIHYKIENVQSYSCGTEATECNSRTVASLQRTGFAIEGSAETNPRYRLQFGGKSIELYSKDFSDPSLPSSAIIAMMCCDDADTKCPVVPGADQRVPLHYVDPKAADGTPSEAATYDERSHQIASEMFFLMRTFRERSARG